jgi:hypothetical protein
LAFAGHFLAAGQFFLGLARRLGPLDGLRRALYAFLGSLLLGASFLVPFHHGLQALPARIIDPAPITG